METTRFGALWRAAVALGRRRRLTEGEEADAEETDESGFTLIELMVVLLIMGILMAIAIPTFLGVTSTANDTSTQSNLTNTLTAAKAIYARNNGWPVQATLISDLTTEEPEFSYLATASPTQKSISVYAKPTTTTLVIAAYMTKTKVCWGVQTVGGKVTYAGVATPTTCTASATLVATASATYKGTKWPTIPGH